MLTNRNLLCIPKYTFSKDVMQKYEESKYDQPSDWVNIIIPIKIINSFKYFQSILHISKSFNIYLSKHITLKLICRQ